MKTKLAILATLFVPALALSAVESNEKAIDTAKSHLDAFLRADAEKLQASYAAQVTLMPGHEFLKPEYGMTEKEGRTEATRVERGKLVKAISDVAKKRPQPSDEKVSALMESLAFTVIETKGDKATVAPSDSVGAPDTQLHFDLKPGDVVVKAAPKKGDYILVHLRPGDGSWQVVAEYLD